MSSSIPETLRSISFLAFGRGGIPSLPSDSCRRGGYEGFSIIRNLNMGLN
jgi:hypothetical protein